MFTSEDYSLFMSKVQPEPNTGCWFWDKSLNPAGYGKIVFNGLSGKIWLAHRASYELFKGEIPKGLHVLHKCDQPACVNPDHLWLGTNEENIQDRINKGRSFRSVGELAGMSKLKLFQVLEIREKYKKGNITQRTLAKEYNVHCSAICNIVTNKAWVDL